MLGISDLILLINSFKSSSLLVWRSFACLTVAESCSMCCKTDDPGEIMLSKSVVSSRIFWISCTSGHFNNYIRTLWSHLLYVLLLKGSRIVKFHGCCGDFASQFSDLQITTVRRSLDFIFAELDWGPLTSRVSSCLSCSSNPTIYVFFVPSVTSDLASEISFGFLLGILHFSQWT